MLNTEIWLVFSISLEAARNENPKTMILGMSNCPLHVSNKNPEKEPKKNTSTQKEICLCFAGLQISSRIGRWIKEATIHNMEENVIYSNAQLILSI